MEAFEYLSEIPQAIPAGRILVHNHVRPAKGLGTRGFRAWLGTPANPRYEICSCGWAPGLAHYLSGIEGRPWPGD